MSGNVGRWGVFFGMHRGSFAFFAALGFGRAVRGRVVCFDDE